MLNLSAREQQIIKLISQDRSLTEIAKQLKLSSRTIGFLVEDIKCKVEKEGESWVALINNIKLN